MFQPTWIMVYRCHCEERSDEAIQLFNDLDCFASLAMTVRHSKIASQSCDQR